MKKIYVCGVSGDLLRVNAVIKTKQDSVCCFGSFNELVVFSAWLLSN